MSRVGLRFRRLFLACALLGVGATAVLLPGGRSAGADDGGALLPEGMILRGGRLIALRDGNLKVDGRGQDGAIFHSANSVDDTLADLRAHWNDRAVDLVETLHPGGAILSVLDIHGGIQWTVSLRAMEGGGTEAIRSVRSLRGEQEAVRQVPLSLPVGWSVVSTLDDPHGPHPSVTWVVVREDEAASLSLAAQAAGWKSLAQEREPPRAGSDEPLLPTFFTREGERLSLATGPGPLGLRWATLRWETR